MEETTSQPIYYSVGDAFVIKDAGIFLIIAGIKFDTCSYDGYYINTIEYYNMSSPEWSFPLSCPVATFDDWVKSETRRGVLVHIGNKYLLAANNF